MEGTFLINGGGWSTNIGNAFLDIGSSNIIKYLDSGNKVYTTSSLYRFIYSNYINRKYNILKNQLKHTNLTNILDIYKPDYLVQTGACLGDDWMAVHGNQLLKANEKGIEILFIGVGLTDLGYQSDHDSIINFIDKLNPKILISRDVETYNVIKKCKNISFDGIDCAFFLNYNFTPIDILPKRLGILNFDKGLRSLPNGLLDECDYIINLHHSFWHNFSIFDYPKMINYYYNGNTYISEIPEEYLNLYSNSYITLSDRVHSCVATTTFGNTAQLFSNSPRLQLFCRVGLDKINVEPSKVDLYKLKNEMIGERKFILDILQ